MYLKVKFTEHYHIKELIKRKDKNKKKSVIIIRVWNGWSI